MSTLKKLTITNPAHVLEFAATLKDFVRKTKLSIEIQGRQYVLVDGWKFAGLNFGYTAIVDKPKPLHQSGQNLWICFINRTDKKGKTKMVPGFCSHNTDMLELYKEKHKVVHEIVKPLFTYECSAVIQKPNGNQIHGNGFATCSNLEVAKSSWDEYSVLSMAQTRAISKAYRNLFGYVMSAAGYEPTPAEEMEDLSDMQIQDPGPESDKNELSMASFEKLVEAIKEGKTSKNAVLANYTLNREQLEIINKL